MHEWPKYIYAIVSKRQGKMPNFNCLEFSNCRRIDIAILEDCGREVEWREKNRINHDDEYDMGVVKEDRENERKK